MDPVDEAKGRVVQATDPTALTRAVNVLRAGGTVVLPTDTVYGLAALPSVPGATRALVDLKVRSEQQPFAVLVAGVGQALGLTEAPAPQVRQWMEHLWPGPLTLVLPRGSASLGLALGGDPATIGVRCPDHRFVREVAAVVGPIATTSANRHGEPTPTTAIQGAEALAGPVDLVVDGGPAGTLASTVVDATTDPWRVLRAGALTEAELRDQR